MSTPTAKLKYNTIGDEQHSLVQGIMVANPLVTYRVTGGKSKIGTYG